MSTWLRTLIGAAVVLVVGLVGGLVLGRLGRGDLEDALQHARRQASEAEESLKRETEDLSQEVKRLRTSRSLLLAKEELLRALLELAANNYGLTSQHLAQARSWLRSAMKNLAKKELEAARSLFERIGEAQSMAMRLDPVAQSRIREILTDLQRLPGAH